MCKHFSVWSLLFVSAICSFTPIAAFGQVVVHDESTDGDLSSGQLAPTQLVLSPGSNIIRGMTTSDPLDRDFWTFSLPAGQWLTAVILDAHDTVEDLSFFAVQEGSEISDITSSSGLLAATLVGGSTGAFVGDDVLDNLGDAGLGGMGFTPPLTAGTYTFWYQEL